MCGINLFVLYVCKDVSVGAIVYVYVYVCIYIRMMSVYKGLPCAHRSENTLDIKPYSSANTQYTKLHTSANTQDTNRGVHTRSKDIQQRVSILTCC